MKVISTSSVEPVGWPKDLAMQPDLVTIVMGADFQLVVMVEMGIHETKVAQWGLSIRQER